MLTPMPDTTQEYRALVEKVAATAAVLVERRSRDMACRSGCESCCHAWLSVSQVEGAHVQAGLQALTDEDRTRVAARGVLEQTREASGEKPARCAMLEPDGRCAIYEHRPLVCRTQGLALRYPPGFIPEGAVRERFADGEVTHCPLNFTHAAPTKTDALDAERVDQLLALVNYRYAQANALEPTLRHALSELAARPAKRPR